MIVKGNQVYCVYHKSHRSTVRTSDEGTRKVKDCEDEKKITVHAKHSNPSFFFFSFFLLPILNPTSTPSTPPYGCNPRSQLTSPFKSVRPSSHRHGNAHLFPNSIGALK